MLKFKYYATKALSRMVKYRVHFLNVLTSLFMQNKHKLILSQLYKRSINTKAIYIHVINVNLEDLVPNRSLSLTKELVSQGYVCLIISTNNLNPSKQFKEIEHNIFITDQIDVVFDIKGAIISICSDVTLYSLKVLKQIKANNNKIIYEYIEQTGTNNKGAKFLAEKPYKKLINNGIIDFAVCTVQSLTEEMQHYLPIDKVLYSPNPEAQDLSQWQQRAESIARCLNFLLAVPSNLSPLPEKLLSVDDKILDVQGEIARSTIHTNNLYYRHCEKLYFLPILNWFDESLKGKKVLDIGCAYGTLSLLLSKHFSCDVYTLDFMDEYYPASLFDKYKIKFRCLNIEVDNIPYKKKFDLVILTEVLEHFNFYPTPSLKKIAAQMNDEGILIITTPDASEWGRTTKYYNSLAAIPYPQIQECYIDDHVWQYNKDELVKVVTDAGFEILELKYAPGMPSVGRHFCLKLKKL